MDRTHFGIRISGKKAKNILGRKTIFDGADGGPLLGEDAREERERPGLIEREPNILTRHLVEFAEGGEWHHAAVFRSQPARPVPARDVSNVGRATIGLHL